jgi:hypothetical protein
MLTLRPHARFLLRSSVLLIGMLGLWWFALRVPMLFLLRESETVVLRLLSSDGSKEPVTEDPSGDWSFRIPVDDTERALSRDTGPVRFRAIEFTIPRADVVLFTFSVPVYWAIALAAPRVRSALRPLLWGTAVMAVVEVISLLALVEIGAHAAIAQMRPSADGLDAWLREFGNDLIVGVIPFAAPVLAAVAFHPGLRSQIFPVARRAGVKTVTQKRGAARS